MTKPTSENLSSNYIRHKKFRLSLPELWCASSPLSTQCSSVKLNFFQFKSGSYGKYEVLDYPHEELSLQQIITLLKTQQFDQIGSVEVHKSANKSTGFYILSKEKADYSDTITPLVFLTLKDDQIHLLQFMLDPSSDSPQVLFNYVFNSLSYYDYSLNYLEHDHFFRQRKGHINFFQNSSTFRWYSDTPSGIVIQGTILNKTAFITIEKAKPKKNPVLLDESSLPLLINNRRVWVHPRAQLLENGIYKIGTVFPGPGGRGITQDLYTFDCLINPRGEKLNEEQILKDQNFRLVFERELFFPQSGDEE